MAKVSVFCRSWRPDQYRAYWQFLAAGCQGLAKPNRPPLPIPAFAGFRDQAGSARKKPRACRSCRQGRHGQSTDVHPGGCKIGESCAVRIFRSAEEPRRVTLAPSPPRAGCRDDGEAGGKAGPSGQSFPVGSYSEYLDVVGLLQVPAERQIRGLDAGLRARYQRSKYPTRSAGHGPAKRAVSGIEEQV